MKTIVLPISFKENEFRRALILDNQVLFEWIYNTQNKDITDKLVNHKLSV